MILAVVQCGQRKRAVPSRAEELYIGPLFQALPGGGDPAFGERVRLELAERGATRIRALASARYLVGWADELGALCPIRGLPIGRAIQAANRLTKESLSCAL